MMNQKLPKEDLLRLVSEAGAPSIGSTWTHKSGSTYRVVAIALDESSLGRLVVYRGDGLTWVRPLSEFTDGRFTRVC